MEFPGLRVPDVMPGRPGTGNPRPLGYIPKPVSTPRKPRTCFCHGRVHPGTPRHSFPYLPWETIPIDWWPISTVVRSNTLLLSHHPGNPGPGGALVLMASGDGFSRSGQLPGMQPPIEPVTRYLGEADVDGRASIVFFFFPHRCPR